jgi:hypothetical protein
MFGIPVFSKALDLVVKEKDIKPLFQHRLVAVLPDKYEAVFQNCRFRLQGAWINLEPTAQDECLGNSLVEQVSHSRLLESC